MRLSVTTPSGALLDTEVEEVTGPGELGEFGVLPGHIPFLSALRPGALTYRTREGVRTLAVGNGLLQISRGAHGDEVQVLVQRAAAARDIDAKAVETELASLDKELASWTGGPGPEYQSLRAKQAWAQARLDSVKRER